MNRNRVDTPEQLEHYKTMIGKVVRKRSGKPFKSKEKNNTVTSIAVNIQTGLVGFRFKEDISIVECWRCVEVE